MVKDKILIFGIGLGVGGIAGLLWEHNRTKRIIEEKIRKLDKSQNYYGLLLSWLKLHAGKIPLDDYFEWHGADKIAVYGNGQIGQCFIKEMECAQTQISYIIDRNAENMVSKLPIFTMEDELPQVDAIVVTVIDEFDNIAEAIRKKCGCSVVSIEEVIYGSIEI